MKRLLNQHPLIYLITIVIVGIVVVVLEQPGTGPNDDRQDFFPFKALDIAAVQTVKIAHFVEGIELKRNGEGWLASSFVTPMAETINAQSGQDAAAVETIVANTQKADALLNAIKDVEIRGVASHDFSAAPQLEANDIGTHVQAYDAAGQVLADLYIGKLSPDMVSTYVRLQGAPVVYLADGYLGGQFPALISAWKKPDDQH
ncbi:MAG: hypothetical protein COV45_04135 [Deltaproteobacteria bacterium CG11_big_fil_rev_8_21_14_0_20_47_16]|nr:MAG: hypothetical protein COV45_04135 [Deltaproteobacteria bacterium CG11_big_fil_rev_8_21_14_0_20_47_16]